ncbi:hypothetical protein EW145_g5948 [Phellinidium pouzarii]|uniref:Bms1-type G domain-containing protein n=1 Tax=Phellinidium pouzarii TaxID=167371 RepID=A0A4S4KY85_9AGAM|nr:hypothetical protein EW145_g5948 [Phellinidium pouzarii]
MDDRTHKPHRSAQSGPKADEKKGKAKEKQTGFNEKAFAPKSGRRAEKQGRRNVERDQTRLHVPLLNRTPDDQPPPIIVAVVGPPGVGKTTLVKSLVKRYTKQTLSEIKGPVTVVSGKKRRLTFIECNVDLNSMIDIGKVADLVLLMIDGSFGFEMEQFEFLNILQSHGFPKVIGVLTHLDLIRKQATLRDIKKMLKKRFWTEIYQGAKLFYLSGVLNGRYPDGEIQNLSRFISVMKFRPLVFRNTHPYLLADRLEDLTSREEIRASKGKCDRIVTVYGYLRGTNFRHKMKVHIPGVGDLDVKSISVLGDPCPLPDADSEKRRKLSEKKKLLVYAPMSDVGGVMYDKDAVWINVPGSFTRGNMEIPQGEGEKMVINLQDAGDTLDNAVSRSRIRLLDSSSKTLAVNANVDEESDFAGVSGEELSSDDDDNASYESRTDGDKEKVESDEDNDSQNEFEHGASDERAVGDRGRSGTRVSQRSLRNLPSTSERPDTAVFAESDSELDFEEARKEKWISGVYTQYSDQDILQLVDNEGLEEGVDNVSRWKEDLSARAVESYNKRLGRKKQIDWMKLIYSSSMSPEDIVLGKSIEVRESEVDADDDGLIQVKKNIVNDEVWDMTKEPLVEADLAQWDDDELLDSLRGLFITGGDTVGDIEENDPQDERDGGDFKDLEASGAGTFIDANTGDSESQREESEDDATARAATLSSKKEALKRMFNEQYDDPEASKLDFYDEKKRRNGPAVGALVEGYRPGSYVRIELENVPCEMIEHFDPMFPIIVGGLLPAEECFGYIQARIKRHRWHAKTLKTNDPLILSLGWRRFQTIPIYSLDDHSIRMRMLKYTPEHMHCYATFYGPVALPNTGFCAFNTLSSETSGFRVSATGVVLDIDRSTKIMKKLKLTGVPLKIFKNTAFIRDMFTSALEVTKFEGANIKTVSGVRGQIKKALGKPEGAFRATFEDKVLMSDIVFLRGWYAIEPRKLYNPVTSLLLSEKGKWTGMRLTGQVRRDENLKTPFDKNSSYKKVERLGRRFNPLKIPKKLQAALPYSSKPKLMKAQHRPTYMQKRAVVLEPEEKRAITILQQVRALRKDQIARRREKQEERRAVHRKRVAKEEEKKGEKEKEKRKEYMRTAGMKSKREADREEGRQSKKRKT